jgi:hypothetical protein
MVTNGVISHTINLKDRGILSGAYCIVKRKSASQSVYVYVSLKEYKQPFGNWNTMPETMIKKVAEAQALRMCFQDVFAGTYDEAERWEETPEEGVKQKTRIVKPIEVKQEVIEAEVVKEKEPEKKPEIKEATDKIVKTVKQDRKQTETNIAMMWHKYYKALQKNNPDKFPDELNKKYLMASIKKITGEEGEELEQISDSGIFTFNLELSLRIDDIKESSKQQSL